MSEILELSELRQILMEAVGRCEWPECVDTYGPFEMAHLRHRGMGGSPSKKVNTLANVVLLCHHHHMVLDGEDRPRRHEMRALVSLIVEGRGWV